MRPRGSAAKLERKRVQAIKLLNKGLGTRSVASKLKVSRQSVQTWKRAVVQMGKVGIESKPNLGRASMLSEDQQSQLNVMFAQGALKAGYATDKWNSARIRDVIFNAFNIHYSQGHACRILRQLRQQLTDANP